VQHIGILKRKFVRIQVDEQISYTEKFRLLGYFRNFVRSPVNSSLLASNGYNIERNITNVTLTPTTWIKWRLSSDVLFFVVLRCLNISSENWNQHTRSPRNHITLNYLLLSSIIFAFVLPDRALRLATLRGSGWLLCQSGPTHKVRPCTISWVLYNIGREQLFKDSVLSRHFSTQVN